MSSIHSEKLIELFRESKNNLNGFQISYRAFIQPFPEFSGGAKNHLNDRNNFFGAGSIKRAAEKFTFKIGSIPS
ncbi:MAG TPA: hypothetical protein DDW50_18780 [Firmicutes bacterium]|jgi:hypothetical protein|nr:hypothetical protein [Bacillota bacterium]